MKKSFVVRECNDDSVSLLGSFTEGNALQLSTCIAYITNRTN